MRRFSLNNILVPLFKGVQIVANEVSRFAGITLFLQQLFRNFFIKLPHPPKLTHKRVPILTPLKRGTRRSVTLTIVIFYVLILKKLLLTFYNGLT